MQKRFFGDNYSPYFLLVFLLLSTSAISQRKSFHGSYVIAAMGKDGIMMSAESRGSFAFFDENRQKIYLAYLDQVSKIYVFKHCALAATGFFQIGNLFLESMVYEFKQSINDDTLNALTVIPSFFRFCEKNTLRISTSLYAKMHI